MSEAAAIHDFIRDFEKFERLLLRTNRFNPFRVLNVSSHEIRHSNVLAWLLDPKQNHGLSDRFFKKLVIQIILDSENEGTAADSIDVKNIYLGDYRDLHVYREAEHMDIHAISDRNHFVLLIENKIYSAEHGSQLDDYLAKLRSSHMQYSVLPVFLTRDATPPSNKKYSVCSHASIYAILSNLTSMYEDYIPDRAYDFIQFYIDTLKEILLMDDETTKLCKEIYREHREAIDLIHRIGIQINVSASVDQFKAAHSEVEVTNANNNAIIFRIPEFRIGRKMNSEWGQGYPFAFWFSEYYGSLKLVLEIGPFDDGQMRVNFLNALDTNGVKIRPSAKSPDRMYTRIWTGTRSIKDWHDKDELLDKMNELYGMKEVKEITEKLVRTINGFSF